MRILLSILLILGSLPVWSQEQIQMDQIDIRGNKEEKTYQESTESISILQGDAYDRSVKTDSVQALNALPNVQINKNDMSFSIRGVNNTGVTGYQKDNLASIIVDDVFQTDLAVKAGSFELWDLDHIEIYRGAQSTSQGINSLAGNILLYHHAPRPQEEGAAKIGLGNFGEKELGIVNNSSWLAGKLDTRISYDKELSDGFIKNVYNGDKTWGFEDKDHLSLDFIYHISNDESLRLNTKWMRAAKGGNYVQGSDPFTYEVDEDQDNSSATINRQGSLHYNKKIDGHWSNEAIAAFSQSGQNAQSDADGTDQDLAGTRYENHRDQFASLENMLRYQDEKLKNVLGLHVHDYKITDHYNFTLLFPLSQTTSTPVGIQQDTAKYQTTYSLYDSALYKLTEHHSLNLGARYEYVVNKFGAYVNGARLQDAGGANGTVDNYLNRVSGAYDGTDRNWILLPKLGYIFEWDRQSVGVSYTQGYRTGGLSINRSRAETNTYAPESTDNFELSYKNGEENLKFSANAFYTKWHDQQVQVQLSNDLYDTQVVNAANSELYGGELETRYTLNLQHEIYVGAGYSKTRFLDFTSNGVDYRNNQFPLAPAWTGQVGHTWRFAERWSWDNVFRYLSASYANAENTKRSPEQYYWDSSAQYAFAATNLMAEFYVKNVLGGQYLLYDGSAKLLGTAYQANYYQVNTPRQFGARLTYFW